MKKLKIILLFSFILSIVILFFRIKNDSVEESNITSIDGIVKEYSVDGDKLNIIIDNYKVIYYFKSEKELNDFNISYISSKKRPEPLEGSKTFVFLSKVYKLSIYFLIEKGV